MWRTTSFRPTGLRLPQTAPLAAAAAVLEVHLVPAVHPAQEQAHRGPELLEVRPARAVHLTRQTLPDQARMRMARPRLLLDVADPAEAVDRAAVVGGLRAWGDPDPINRAVRPFGMS